uniref:Elongation of fatty acids protein n=1 Tax=Neobodo designis TaxID=312471 RepID=A0A7S1MTL2_NEODS|mmetsp:Transcript_46609/g.143755  ORF Transcript_46609/g.143755 Transcript_46609/m.143755 type:complete len:295 (+) Transcript_46609:37-921(+)
MEYVTSAIVALREAEASFTGAPLGRWMLEYADLPFYAAFLYVGMVFGGQAWMKDRAAFNLKPLFIVWNLILATFSIYGASVSVPYLFDHLTTRGFRFTVCHSSFEWWANGPVGLWMAVFGLSKIPELMDTVFLVFQKKPVIFLHWYHHTTVMLYCWHAYLHGVAPGLWFASMNFFVHSIMYGYYFMMNLSNVTRKIVKPLAQTITTLQLLQMVVGMTAIVAAFYYLDNHPDSCAIDRANSRMGLIMYTSYFILFASLFKKLYLTPKPKGAKGKKADDDSICNAATAAMEKSKSS